MTDAASMAPQTPDPALAVQTLNLSKMFGDRVAVDGLDLGIKKGELFVLLGPDGAGKTTIIRMLCCLLKPGGGTASVMGYDILNEPYEVKKLIGLSPQDPSFSEHLTPLENLELVAGLYGLPPAKARKWSRLMLETMGLEGHARDQVRKLPAGMRGLLSIAMALIHDPPVLVLDEPTLGLPRMRRTVRDYVGRLKGEKTILLATRYAEEADLLADRIGIIDGGKLAALGSGIELKTDILDKHTIVVKGWNITQNAVMNLHRYYADIKVEGGTLLITDRHLDFNDVVSRTRAEGISLRSAFFKEPSLDDVFLSFTGKELGA